MLRECNFEDISDGRTYELNDMVKCDTGDCKECHKCCTGMGTSIVIDPFDVWRLKKYFNLSFEDLLQKGFIELNMVDGLILPNLKMNEKDECSFLDENGRCSIHKERPGICRVFPLGRIYHGEKFKYFVQKGQCVRESKLAKIKVKKWIDTENLIENQAFILKWHDFIRYVGDKMITLRDGGMGDILNEIAMYVLNVFFVKDFETDTKKDGRTDNADVEKVTDKEDTVEELTIYDIISDRIDEAYKSIDSL